RQRRLSEDALAVDLAGERVANRAAVDVGREGEADILSVEARVFELDRAAANPRRARERLVALVERDLVGRRLAADRQLPAPRPGDPRRDDPEIDFARAARSAPAAARIHRH